MRVVVTGMGLIDALGESPEASYANYLADVNPLSDIIVPNQFNHKINQKKCFPSNRNVNVDFVPMSVRKALPINARYALHATEQAIKDSGVQPSENVAVIFSSLAGGMELEELELSKIKYSEGGKPSPRNMIGIPIDYACSLISTLYKFKGNNTCMYSACATGIVSIDYAMKTLLEEDHDYVIVGAADAMINHTDLHFFNTIGALSNDDQPNASRPFDVTRNGFVMGDGAGALILEREDKALARGAKIYGVIGGIGIASDAYNSVAPDPNGSAAKAAMRIAMRKASVSKVDYVNAHATSTPVGDQIEYESIYEVCGNVTTSSLKGKIGHTMAAAGIIETIYTLMMMNKGIICHNANLDQPLGDKINLITQPSSLNIFAALNNSFGFGGKCASICLLKE